VICWISGAHSSAHEKENHLLRCIALKHSSS
jgi:hypothetical protein